ncbi:MAG TPA: hypothetical protein VMZ31_07820 [Phycisphaerae bacterium]|nr:hypothetical protein [Phycisphaerae bacterium]
MTKHGIRKGMLFRFSTMTALLAGLTAMALTASCGTRQLTNDTTGQETSGSTEQTSDADLAYDRAALMAAMANYIEYGPDNQPLAYTFALLFVWQNHISAACAFDVEVNGEFVERRVVEAGTQEIVAITNEMVRDTEAIMGVVSEDIPLLGRPTPFVVRLTNFVCDDDHIIQDMNMILSPLNAFTTNWRPITKDVPEIILGPHYVSPAVLAFVVEKTRIQVIEVDREDMPDEPDENEALEPEEIKWPELCTLFYLTEQENVLAALGYGALIPSSICQ